MQKRYWLRGGVIGVIIIFLFLLLQLAVCGIDYVNAPSICSTAQSVFHQLGNRGVYFIYIIFLVLCSLVGWVYGKNKNKIN